jgi:hypothetical protein
VCFYFGCYSVASVEANNTCVVFEDAEAPAWFYRFSGFCDVRFEEAMDFLVAYAYFALEGFMKAVLGPCLCYGLKFHVSWISILFLEVGLDGFHFLQV